MCIIQMVQWNFSNLKTSNMTDIKNEPAQAIRVDYPDNSGSEYYYGYTKYEDALLKITCALVSNPETNTSFPEGVILEAEKLTDAYFNSLNNKPTTNE